MFKKSITALLLTLITLFLLACSDTTTESDVKPTQSKIVMKTINVKGMTCEGCEGAIVDYLTKMDGVVSSKASHAQESVVVKYDEAKTDIDAIMKTISSTGYKVNGLKENTPKD
ncbi:MAG: mercuric ion transport protein [Sulfurimonas sp.]|jgi:mercuric ion transport protein|uniref:cation transporter n=1 Tax=Sulfurimonas sp. TaxID=2022749 RepID=UPI0039E45B71